MAKKRKKEEKKEVFRKPEFDEVEFMKKEIVTTKGALITILFALPIAAVSFGLTLVGLPAAGFLIGIGSIFLLKYVLDLFHVDTEKFEIKDKLGNGAMFFFTWLAVWVLILNVPFADLTTPTIADIRILGCPDQPVIKVKSGKIHTCEIATGSRNFTIQAKVTDNSDVGNVILHMTSPSSKTYDMIEYSNNEYSLSILLSAGDNLIFYIEAEDINGHRVASPSYTLMLST